MSAPPAPAPGAPQIRIGFRTFVIIAAALMALNALAIDIMLPALPQMAHDFGLTDQNRAQWIVASYVLGFGCAQLIYGPLSDRFGRRPLVLIGVGLYAITGAVAAFASTFELMIVARVAQGIAAASSRTLAIAIVRDRFEGRQMARVMSLTFIIFMIIPIIAPTIGQTILTFAHWQWIFLLLVIYATILFIAIWLLLPETLHPEYRQPLEPARILAAARLAATERLSVGYTLASTLLFGSLMGFINSSQQVFEVVFSAPKLFPYIFALAAGTMALGAFFNSRIVERLGTRRVSHSALIGFTAIAFIHVVICLIGLETIWTFTITQATIMGCFALAISNFGSLAMDRLGAIAGTASSVQGFVSTIIGAVIGITIGQLFNGSTLPLALGYFTLGTSALVIVLVTERGHLFGGPIRSAAAAAAGEP
jgi:DHA1 family bicyclomycin/chloramphenicol resistance-like MFS transporter